jgi:shikimate dehydrogenase
MTLRLGLVGHPIDASLSPAMHTAALAALGIAGSYVRCDVAPDGLPGAWPQLVGDLDGFNVTVPHKQVAAALVDTLTDEARLAGSVNTVIIDATSGSRRTTGATTDGAGVAAAVARVGAWPPATALILGTGGAARAIAAHLLLAGVEVSVAGRRQEAAQQLVSALSGAGSIHIVDLADDQAVAAAAARSQLIVNATPLGSAASPAACPLPATAALRPDQTVLDAVYWPALTPLLRRAGDAGATAIAGIEMLIEQGARSLELWTGRAAPVDVMRRAAHDDYAARAAAMLEGAGAPDGKD